MSAIRQRRFLTHWEADNGIYFVTYRLADSLPKSSIDRITRAIDFNEDNDHRFSYHLERLLDSGAGQCYLARAEIASIVAESLKKFDQLRYRLHAWCIMPNHIHAVMQPLNEWTLAKIIHTWKSYTAKQANILLAREGEFWQREYYDHLIRDSKDLARIIEYVHKNPQKAGLTNWPWLWIKP
jgi:REP element-mobilizing transposase RayT